MSNAFLFTGVIYVQHTGKRAHVREPGRHDSSFTTCNTYNIKGIKTRAAAPDKRVTQRTGRSCGKW